MKMIALSIDSVQDHLSWSKVWGVRGCKGSLSCCQALEARGKAQTGQSTGLELRIC